MEDSRPVLEPVSSISATGPFVTLAGHFPSPGLCFLYCMKGVDRCAPECSPRSHVPSKSTISELLLRPRWPLCCMDLTGWLEKKCFFFFGGKMNIMRISFLNELLFI